MSSIAYLGQKQQQQYMRYTPYGASPARSAGSDDASSDDGSIGPQDYVAPVAKKVTTLPTSIVPQQQQIATTTASMRPAPRPVLKAKDALDIFTHAMTFMRLEDIEAARHVAPALEAAANRVAPKPLGDKDVVFMRWEPQQLRTAVAAPVAAKPTGPATKRGAHGQAAAAPAVFPWRCLSCGHVSVGPRQCQHCRAPLAQSACRVFLGQLRKDLSAELATAMIRSVAPDVTILHMESHTNGADGRGKGCAWAYVSTVEDALRVTALHKRVFIDIDADGGEGFWFVQDAALVARLGVFADTIGASRTRPVYFPRQPLVAELPAKSMLAEFVKQQQQH